MTIRNDVKLVSMRLDLLHEAVTISFLSEIYNQEVESDLTYWDVTMDIILIVY